MIINDFKKSDEVPTNLHLTVVTQAQQAKFAQLRK